MCAATCCIVNLPGNLKSWPLGILNERFYKVCSLLQICSLTESNAKSPKRSSMFSVVKPRNRPARKATRMAKDKQPKPILKIYWVRKKEKSPFMWKIVYIGSARGHQLRGTCRKLPVGLVQPRKKWESLGVESKAWFWSSTQVDWTPTQSRLKYNQVHRKSPFSLERGSLLNAAFPLDFIRKTKKKALLYYYIRDCQMKMTSWVLRTAGKEWPLKPHYLRNSLIWSVPYPPKHPRSFFFRYEFTSPTSLEKRP